MKVEDLLHLASANVQNAEERIEKVHDWMFQSRQSFSAWSLGLSASLTLLILGALLASPKDGTIVKAATYAWLAVGPVATATAGVMGYVRAARTPQQLVDALYLYDRLRNVGPFMRLYERHRSGRR